MVSNSWQKFITNYTFDTRAKSGQGREEGGTLYTLLTNNIGKKFAVTYKSKEELEEVLNATLDDDDAKFLVHLQVLYAKGRVELKSKHSFANTKFTSVEELLAKTYGK
jgi:hypothetical protein